MQIESSAHELWEFDKKIERALARQIFCDDPIIMNEVNDNRFDSSRANSMHVNEICIAVRHTVGMINLPNYTSAYSTKFITTLMDQLCMNVGIVCIKLCIPHDIDSVRNNFEIIMNRLPSSIIDLRLHGSGSELGDRHTNAICRFLTNNATLKRFTLMHELSTIVNLKILDRLADITTLTQLHIAIPLRWRQIAALINVLKNNKSLKCLSVSLRYIDVAANVDATELFDVLEILTITHLRITFPFTMAIFHLTRVIKNNHNIISYTIGYSTSTISPSSTILTNAVIESKHIRELKTFLQHNDTCRLLADAKHLTTLESTNTRYAINDYIAIAAALGTNLTLLASRSLSRNNSLCKQYLERNNVIKKSNVHKIILDVTTVLYPILNAWVILEIILHQCAPYQNYIARTFIVDTIFAIIRSVDKL